jgi:hypothetical protein
VELWHSASSLTIKGRHYTTWLCLSSSYPPEREVDAEDEDGYEDGDEDDDDDNADDADGDDEHEDEDGEDDATDDNVGDGECAGIDDADAEADDE